MIRKCLEDSFPWWFFPLYRSLGILPLHPNSQGIRFDPKTAPVGIVLLTMALLSFMYGLIGFSFLANIPLLKQGVWLLTGFSGIIGALISISVMVIQCKKIRFCEIIETVAAAEKLIVVDDRSRVGIFHQLDKITVGMYVLLTCFLIPLTILYQKMTTQRLYLSCPAVHSFSLWLQECVLPTQEIRQCHLLQSPEQSPQGHQLSMHGPADEHIHESVHPRYSKSEFHHRLLRSVKELVRINTISMLVQLLWFLFSLTSLVSITWTCTYTTYHGKNVAFFISNLLSLDLPSVYRKQKKDSACNNHCGPVLL
ncbi:hypothetical protein J6590_087001 [Homalodisca vitripennis]|nr:hypothetical protein J6590_087001 [Homalodisca vitripennis]